MDTDEILERLRGYIYALREDGHTPTAVLLGPAAYRCVAAKAAGGYLTATPTVFGVPLKLDAGGFLSAPNSVGLEWAPTYPLT